MKKIVGIIGAALLASSIFAVDFSAGVRFEGDLFNYSVSKTAGSKLNAIMEQHNNQFYHAPIAFSISGDAAGATLKLTDKDGEDVLSGAWSLWFKPLDMLKITVGAHDFALNQEHIGWCNSETHLETTGYALNLGLNAFNMNLILNQGNSGYFITAKGTADPVVKELAATFSYGADFGTVNAFFDAANTFSDYRFAAGYNAGGLLPVGLWVNVIGYAGNKFEEFKAVRGEVDVTATFGPVSNETFIAGGYNFKAMKDFNNNFGGSESWHVGYIEDAEKPFVGFYTKFTMPVEGFGLYLEVKDSNVLADDFAIEIKPGFTKNVGACAIDLGIKVNVNTYKTAYDTNGDITKSPYDNKIAVSVPVSFAVNF